MQVDYQASFIETIVLVNSRPNRFSKPVRSVHYIPIFPLQGAYRLSFSATQGDAIGLEYTTTSWRRRGQYFKQIIPSSFSPLGG
jgi:hypothetical protein